ncbi:MAG: hypothetical protein AB7D36_05520 [Oscillospiraceae bacterium]
MDIETVLLPWGNTVCFNDNFTNDRLISLWDETEKRLASIENMNLRGIILSTLARRGKKKIGINAD